MTHPYRDNQTPKPIWVTVWINSILWSFRSFQWARQRLGGHWERHWHSPSPHDSGYGEWGRWEQVSQCTEKYPGEFTRYDTAGCPIYDQCEDYPGGTTT